MPEPSERGPLHNFEAEQAVLGAILANNAAYGACADFLAPEAFADAFQGRVTPARAAGDTDHALMAQTARAMNLPAARLVDSNGGDDVA